MENNSQGGEAAVVTVVNSIMSPIMIAYGVPMPWKGPSRNKPSIYCGTVEIAGPGTSVKNFAT